MDEEIKKRFDELVQEGTALISSLPRNSRGEFATYVDEGRQVQYYAWLNSTVNLIRTIANEQSPYLDECRRLMNHDLMRGGIPSTVISKMLGIVMSAQKEWSAGLMRKIEYMVAAATFDDFLDHSQTYHKANKKVESSVLASAVLEDTVKRIARKNGIDPSGTALEALIDQLCSKQVFTPVKAKRVKSFAGVRNHALHADFDKFDIQDVGPMISGIRELIDQFL